VCELDVVIAVCDHAAGEFGVSKRALTGKACLAPACLRQAVKVNFFHAIVLADMCYRLLQLSKRCITSVA
jgi:hypothetical protein